MEKENIKLIHGDCFEVMNNIDDKSIDLILTDIPYGEVNRQSNGLRNLDKQKADVVDFNITELVNLLCKKSKGSIYIFCGTKQVSEIIHAMANNGLSTRLIIWEKTNPSPMNGQSIWLSGIECCVFGKFKGAVFNEHCKNCVLRFPTQKGKIHPTMKPLKLFEYIMTVSSNENDLVLDCFAGSMTTAIAAINLKRKCICIEKDKTYFESGKQRVENHLINNNILF